MTLALITEADLAANVLGIPEDRAARLRRDKRWPHVRLGRYDIRYTEEQVAQIVAMQSRTSERRGSGPAIAGQTSRSKKAAS